MTTTERGNLATLEGRRVSVALRDGHRIDDGQLISAGVEPLDSIWLFTNGADRFIAFDDVIDVWEVLPSARPGAG